MRLMTVGAAQLLGSALLLSVGCGLNENHPLWNRPVVSLDRPPPPITGGTLTVTRDGRHALVVDPDRDRLVRVELGTLAVREVTLPAGLAPTRVVEDGRGRAYIAPRRGAALVAVDVDGPTVSGSIEVCDAPRGIDWDEVADEIHVACADGTLVTLGPDRQLERRLQLPPGLRDVVVTDAGLLVSRLRSAEILRVTPAGEVVHGSPIPPATLTGIDEGGQPSELRQTYEPGVAVRMRRSAEGGVVVLHQRARVGQEVALRSRRVERVPVRPRSYSYSNRPVTFRDVVTFEEVTWRDPCDNAVLHPAATFLSAEGTPIHTAPSMTRAVLPVDVAVSAGGQLAAAFAGELGWVSRLGPQVLVSRVEEARADRPTGCLHDEGNRTYPGQVVAVAFSGETLLVQLREPSRLMVGDHEVDLGGAPRRDSGHELFHIDSGGAIACASCHPGGEEDGHVWDFAATGPVRTLSLPGAVGLAPYHRAGDVPSFDRLMGTLTEQMDGPPLEPAELDAVERWLTRLPPPAAGPTSSPEAVARGEAVFLRPDVGCASCHQGETGTDGRSHDLGDGAWQTPALAGVALRPPYLHDGRAPDLRAALMAPDLEHGDLSGLSEQDVEDLLAYVRAR